MDLSALVHDVAMGIGVDERRSILVSGGHASIAAVAKYLAATDDSISATERLEDIVKTILLALLKDGAPAEVAPAIARAQKEIGFFLKYKSYAVKAASPLGYSVFLQRPGEGFSFQRHVAHKVEIFHILEASPDAFVFICTYNQWRSVFEPGRFRRWLEGEQDPAFEQFRYRPHPGDVFAIDQLNVVHTVFGCVLEEFATVSTDMVDRLHDQNVGKSVPADLCRAKALSTLRSLPSVEPATYVRATPSGFRREPITAETASWGEVRRLSVGPIRARHLVVEPGASIEPEKDANNAASLFVRSGKGELVFHGEQDHLVSIAAGDLLMIAPDTVWSVSADPSAPMRLSYHGLPLLTALRPDE